MNLDKILDFISRFVDFFVGFAVGNAFGSSKSQKLEAENEKLKVEKEIADAKAKIDLHYATTPNADLLNEVLGDGTNSGDGEKDH